jgi:mannose-6-phosphate isomerase-like protein (cupin superfamily)
MSTGHENTPMQRLLAERGSRNLWKELLELRDEQREGAKGAVWLIKGKDLPEECNRQGLMTWYMHPLLKGNCINTLQLNVQRIPPGGRSGRLHHPGDQVIYVWGGRGYTMIDGQKHTWSAGDVVLLPLRIRGVTIQHFNLDDVEEAKLILCEPNQVHQTTVDRGSGFEQLEDCPDYIEPQ